MSNLPELKSNLKQLIAEGVNYAIKRLEEVLLPESDKFNEFVLLKGRYNTYLNAVIIGGTSKAELDEQYNEIAAALLHFSDSLREGFVQLEQTPAPAQSKRGELLYHIPQEMQVEQEYKCAVRVAYLREVLLEGWQVQKEDVQESIPVAEVMSVELLNQDASEPFSIRTFSDTIQFLDEGYPTEWEFYVKALREGAFPLLLKVSVVETRNGRDIKRNVVIEARVVVSTSAPTEVEPTFRRGDVNLSFDGVPSESTVSFASEPTVSEAGAPSAPSSGTPSSANRPLRALALFLGFVMLGATTTWAFTPKDTQDWWWTRYVQNDEAAYTQFIETHPQSKHLEKAAYRRAVIAPTLENLRACETLVQDAGLRAEVAKKRADMEPLPQVQVPTGSTPDAPALSSPSETPQKETAPSGTSQTPASPASSLTKPDGKQPGDPATPAEKAPRSIAQPPKTVETPAFNTPPPSPPAPPNISPSVPTRVVTFDLVRVTGGTYVMGDNTDAEADNCEHSVTVNSFSIAKYEVTQAEWKAVMGTQPSGFGGCDQCPVENVTWNDVQAFLKNLNRLSGKTYRLPTEEEWEYAARGGSLAHGYAHAGSSNLGSVSWHKGNSADKTHPVGSKAANELGLYDMTGNVWEWCQDQWAAYPGCTIDDCAGCRVLRGGSWANVVPVSRVGYRIRNTPSKTYNFFGFRVAL